MAGSWVEFCGWFQATPPRIDLNVLNILAEVLIELRDFEKRAYMISTKINEEYHGIPMDLEKG